MYYENAPKLRKGAQGAYVCTFIEKMINDNYTCFLYNSESVTSSIGSEHLFVPTRRRGIIKL